MAAPAAAAGPAVLLGLRDAAVPRGSGPAGPPLHGAASKLGGSPDRIPSVVLVHPACGICGASLVHIVQVYCPLEGSPFHRIINVFACAKESCWGNMESWKALRTQYLQVQRKGQQDWNLEQKEECIPAAKGWCEEADDWGEDSGVVPPGLAPSRSHLDPLPATDPLPGEEDCAAQFQGLRLGKAPHASAPSSSRDPTGKELVASSCVPVFRSYFIAVVDEEDYLGCEDTGHVQRLLMEYQKREGVDLEQIVLESSASDERYEKSKAGKRDPVFHKFMKRISACQKQILRYSWGGHPLFISSPAVDAKAAVPPCHTCGSKRTFEFQLMPSLVSMLRAGAEDVSVEFGTALVYTCEKSCWPAEQRTPLEEFVFVQEDPDQDLFK
ncbi:programmed cell death protein 2-like [Varanus komodoensis]|uniref:Programmed cell death protein 2 C-terminal domain-containing protein n=1 Tax=Varanus komodoensis TaxID=61221 RepID=A0A8D2J8J4_VARKO|nr:programmed cell death protein 2-like [Varanus komodoensis]